MSSDIPAQRKPASGVSYRFGPFEVNAAAGNLLRQGRLVKLQDQPFQCLLALLERNGEVVSREELCRRLWPDDTFVDFDKSLGVAVTKLRGALEDDAERPTFIETVPRKGYRFLTPVERIFQEPTIAHAPLALPSTPPPLPTASAARNQPSRVNITQGLLILTAAALLVGAFVFRSLRSQSASTAEAKNASSIPQIRRSVAVLGFRNLPGRKDEDWLSQAFSEMVSTELAAGGGLRVVSDEDVARAKREVLIRSGETLAKSTLEQLRKNPGADVVVVGSYTTMLGTRGDRIRLDIRLQDTTSGETVAEEAVTGSKDDLFELVARAGSHLRQNLGVGTLSGDSANGVQASLPANQNAIRYYSEGKARLWDFDLIGARDLLVKAVAADPSHSLAHAALSNAWLHLGYRSKAAAEAKRALDLSRNLPQSEKLLIAASYWELSSDLPRAVEVYRSLFELHPDSLEYGLDLARAQYQLKPEDALATLKSLRQLPPPTGDDPRIDLLEASAQLTQNVVAARAAANRALTKGTALGSPFIVARAYGILCQQGSSLGVSTAETISDCQKAKDSYAAEGDRNNEARTLNDMAGIYYELGDLHKAEFMWREAAKEFRQNGGAEELAATSNNIGAAFFQEGRLPEARKMFEESIPSYQAAEDKSGLALVLNDLGDLSTLQGNLDRAEAAYKQAKAFANEVGDKSALAYVDSGLGDLQRERGDLAGARKSYEESLTLRTQTGERQAEAETQVHLAKLSIDEGHASDAELSLRKSITQFHQQQQGDEELMARIVAIQALLWQGKVAGAQLELEDAAPLAAKSQNFLARLQFDLASARVSMASGGAQAARRKLQETLTKAREHGYVGIELDCRLANAELERKSGRAAAAQSQVSALERDARARGFGLIARRLTAAENTR
ncbi:MAG: tetratricopeptide repeat protein [Candidatus Acidiferrum sp.]